MLHGFRRLSLFPYIYETNNNNEFLYKNVEKKYFDIDSTFLAIYNWKFRVASI